MTSLSPLEKLELKKICDQQLGDPMTRIETTMFIGLLTTGTLVGLAALCGAMWLIAQVL